MYSLASLWFCLSLAIQPLASTLMLAPEAPNASLADHFELLVDSTTDLEIQEIQAQTGWKPLNTFGTNFGFSESAIWLRGKIRHESPEPLTRWLEIGQEAAQHTELFIPDGNGGWEKRSLDSGAPFSLRAIQASPAVFPLHLKPNQSTEIYIRLVAQKSLSLLMRLHTPESFVGFERNRTLAVSFYLGLFLAVILYSFVAWLHTKRLLFAYHCAFALALAGLFSRPNGLMAQFIESPVLELYSGPLFGAAAIISGIYFLNRYFQLATVAPNQHRVVQLTSVALTSTTLLLFVLPFQQAMPIILGAMASAILIWASLTTIAVKQRRLGAKLYALAWGGFLIGGLIYLLSLLGILSEEKRAQRVIEVAVISQVLILSLAAARQFMTLERQEKEHERTLRKLERSEQLANLGALIASVGHEIANPINTITLILTAHNKHLDTMRSGLTELSGRSAEPALSNLSKHIDKGIELIDVANNAARALSVISRALRTQSRHEHEATDRVDINQILTECIVLMSARLRDMEVVEKLEEDLSPIKCYRSAIGQVAINLLANSADELERGGQILVTTRSLIREGTQGVCFSIADSGRGIPQELSDQVFHEFFTTKPAGIGTGLGLWLCQSIVTRHRGSIQLTPHSELGGAQFTVWLPCEPEFENHSKATS